jgi:hypothetical protein
MTQDFFETTLKLNLSENLQSGKPLHRHLRAFFNKRSGQQCWTIQYDEVLILLEGGLHVHTNAKIHKLSVHDSLWLPTGTELVCEANNALEGEHKADCVVLGAGFAGLAAARRLAENRPQDHIILI